MGHIHTETGQHDFTVSAFIMDLSGPEPALLLHKHKKLGLWLQFGGHVELEENPWGAITHELAEESGYAMDQLKLLQPVMRLSGMSDANLHPHPLSMQTHQFGDTAHYHTDTAYAFVTHEDPTGKIDEGESADIKRFTAAELTALPTRTVPENVRVIGLFSLDQCLQSWVEVDTAEFSA